MRFLCLHGRGTNSDIFEGQLASLSSRLASYHTFDFLDAQYECSPAPGISNLFSAPYFAWYSQYETQHVQDVHDFLMPVIEEDGPYDGVIGFSEGAAVAASLLLVDEEDARRNDRNPLFKVAVFFNGVMVFSPSEDIGTDMTTEVRKQEEDLVYFLNGIDPSALDSGYSSEDSLGVDKPIVDGAARIFGFQADFCSSRISIPTLHFIGENDQFAGHGRNLVKLCGSEMAEVMVFEGGHELPRKQEDLDRSANLFELVVALASVGID